MKDKTPEQQNKYKATLLRKLKFHLYHSASSLEEYANIGTLYKNTYYSYKGNRVNITPKKRTENDAVPGN